MVPIVHHTIVNDMVVVSSYSRFLYYLFEASIYCEASVHKYTLYIKFIFSSFSPTITNISTITNINHYNHYIHYKPSINYG